MKFILVEENELEKRAKYHRKRQKGLSPFYSPDGGNVPLAMDKFNNSVSDDANGLMESNWKRRWEGSDDLVKGDYVIEHDLEDPSYWYVKKVEGKNGERSAKIGEFRSRSAAKKFADSKINEDWNVKYYSAYKTFGLEKSLEEKYDGRITQLRPGDKFRCEEDEGINEFLSLKKERNGFMVTYIDRNSKVRTMFLDANDFIEIVETKSLDERYSLPEVDNAIDHFRYDLGRNPEVDEVIDYMVRMGDVEEPDDPMKASKWYSGWASEISARLNEDTVKNSDGTWSNKGDEGSHGKFKTKKKADAQRKAMFANGYKNESLLQERSGDSARLDQRSKKYIADPAANAINSLLGLEKRGKGRSGSKNSFNSRQGGNGSWNEKTVIKIGGRNFEIMCRKYGFLQKDYNIHNVLREASAKGIKLGDLAWRIKNEGSTNKSVKWIANAIMKFVSKNESLTEAWFTPLSEVSSFTGWMDDDNLINEEERFNSKLERVLKTNRNDIQVLIDSDFEYDPRTYDIEDMTQLQEVRTKNIHANKFLVNGIEFVFEDASSSSSPRLYFKSEEDGEAYTNYIDHYYDEEM